MVCGFRVSGFRPTHNDVYVQPVLAENLLVAAKLNSEDGTPETIFEHPTLQHSSTPIFHEFYGDKEKTPPVLCQSRALSGFFAKKP